MVGRVVYFTCPGRDDWHFGLVHSRRELLKAGAKFEIGMSGWDVVAWKHNRHDCPLSNELPSLFDQDGHFQIGFSHHNYQDLV
jgi:hypothetical protein